LEEWVNEKISNFEEKKMAADDHSILLHRCKCKLMSIKWPGETSDGATEVYHEYFFSCVAAKDEPKLKAREHNKSVFIQVLE